MPLGASISFISLIFSKEHAILQMRNLIQKGLITFLRPQKAEPEYKPRFFGIQNSYHFRTLKDCWTQNMVSNFKDRFALSHSYSYSEMYTVVLRKTPSPEDSTRKWMWQMSDNLEMSRMVSAWTVAHLLKIWFTWKNWLQKNLMSPIWYGTWKIWMELASRQLRTYLGVKLGLNLGVHSM